MGVGLKMQEESERKAWRLILSVVPWRRRRRTSPRTKRKANLGDSSSGVGTLSDPPVPGPSSFLEMSTSETNWLLGGVRRFLEKKLSTPPESDIVQQTYTFHKRE